MSAGFLASHAESFVTAQNFPDKYATHTPVPKSVIAHPAAITASTSMLASHLASAIQCRSVDPVSSAASVSLFRASVSVFRNCRFSTERSPCEAPFARSVDTRFNKPKIRELCTTPHRTLAPETCGKLSRAAACISKSDDGRWGVNRAGFC